MDAQIKVEAMTAGARMETPVTRVKTDFVYEEVMYYVASTLSVLSVGNASISAIPAPTLIKEREVTSLDLIGLG